MENNAWPSTIRHGYDWYLRPRTGYFSTKKVCETVHIQHSSPNDSIVVVNSTYHSYWGIRAKVRALSLDLTEKFAREATADAAPAAGTLFPVPKIEGPTVLRLALDDSAGHALSRNFYGLSTKPVASDWDKSTGHYAPIGPFADFTALSSLPCVSPETSGKSRTGGLDKVTRVTLKNPSSSLAFLIRLQTRKGKDGEYVRPIYWQDNYVSLLACEMWEITARYAASDLASAKSAARVDGWNWETTTQ